MNRADAVKQAMIWDAAAKKAYARAARWREALDADARAELAEQGTAPTWRLPELGQVTLPVSHEAVIVTDREELAKWVQVNRPAEVETVIKVRPAFEAHLLQAGRIDGEQVIDAEGTVIPGLGVRPGGVPGTLTFRPSSAAKEALGQAAEAVLDAVSAALHLPAPPEVPDAA